MLKITGIVNRETVWRSARLHSVYFSVLTVIPKTAILIYMKKTGIIYTSVHHKNTERLLKEAVKNLSVELLTVNDAACADFSAYEAVGFASGIYAGKLHASIYKCIKNRKEALPKRCFIFCTSGVGKGGYAKNRPDEKDVQKAAAFLKTVIGAE